MTIRTHVAAMCRVLMGGEPVATHEDLEAVTGVIEAVIMAERDACAKIAEAAKCTCLAGDEPHEPWCAHGVAAAIRARSSP